MATGAATPGRIAKWLGRYCVYRFPGCTCRLSPAYMAFYQSLVELAKVEDEDGRDDDAAQEETI